MVISGPSIFCCVALLIAEASVTAFINWAGRAIAVTMKPSYWSHTIPRESLESPSPEVKSPRWLDSKCVCRMVLDIDPYVMSHAEEEVHMMAL